MSIYLCADGHEEICHETSKCPVCELVEEKDGEIESLEEEIMDLKMAVDDLQCELIEANKSIDRGVEDEKSVSDKGFERRNDR